MRHASSSTLNQTQWRSEGIWRPGTNIFYTPALPAPIGCYRPLVRFIQNRSIYSVMHHWACVKFCTQRQWRQSKFNVYWGGRYFTPHRQGTKLSRSPRSKGPRAWDGVVFYAPPYQLEDLGECCKLLQWGF